MDHKYTLKDLELPNDEPMVIVRSSMLWMCDGDKYAAAALNMYIYWTKWLIKNRAMARKINKMMMLKNGRIFDEDSIIIYRSQAVLLENLLGFCSEKRLRQANALLVAKGLLKIEDTSRHMGDHTLKYEVQVDKFKEMLAAWRKYRGDDDEDEEITASTTKSAPGENINPSRKRELQAMPYAEYLLTPEWQSRRKQALRFAGFRCQICNASESLNVHHRQYLKNGRGSEPLNELTVLCRDCHSIFHANTERI